jgi:CRISPR-associated protein Cas1
MKGAYETDQSERGEVRGELIPASMVRKYAYCPRLFYLEYVQGEWAENADTLEGRVVHRRVDREGGRLPEGQALSPGEKLSARSITLAAPHLGLIGKIDLVEGEEGEVWPVDYKKGTPGPDGPREPELLQLCAEGLLLQENGYRCGQGVLYYAETRQRVPVRFHDVLVEQTRRALEEMQRVARDSLPPPPLVNSPKCPRCALVGICLPDEVVFLRGERTEEVRRLVPARDDATPVYVAEQGAVVGVSGERLTVRRREGEPVSVRLLDVSQVSLYGNVQVTAQALRALAERGVPIFHHTYGGWLAAVTSGVLSHNAQLRCEQYRVADDAQRALNIARAIVAGKLQNQRTLLRRNHPGCPPAALRELARLTKAARQASDADRLFGIEGLGARVYFGHFAGMLKDPMGFDAAGRDRRPAPDPVNAMLSFLYALLLKDAVRALLAVGLDPYRGLYHRMRPGRPSLALDLMEEFRPIVADSVVLWLVNNRVVAPEDFVRRGPACALKDGARRRVIEAYEARMDTLIQHPLFGYQASYRRVLEIQARLLARAITGELRAYKPFTTR